MVYGFAVFHKLNTAFFDPVSSCAGRLLRQALAMNGLDPDLPGAGVVAPAAVGTVVVEAAILVLLAVPGLRRWGLLLGVGFHSVLALASFYDFATTVFALYLLLVPARVFAAMGPVSGRLRRWALVAFAFADHRREGGRWPGWRPNPALLLVPLLAFANGAAPYLG